MNVIITHIITYQPDVGDGGCELGVADGDFVDCESSDGDEHDHHHHHHHHDHHHGHDHDHDHYNDHTPCHCNGCSNNPNLNRH